MENPDRMEWVPTSLCDNPSLSPPKTSVPALNEFGCNLWGDCYFFEALSRPCLLVCHVFFLSMSPVRLWFLPICAPGRGLWLSTIVSLWRFWPRFSMCWMLVRHYQIDGGSHCRGKFLCIFCKNVYPLSEGWVSWLCQTGFVTLRRRMMTKGLSSALVGSPPGISLWFLNVWGMCTTYTSCKTAWS